MALKGAQEGPIVVHLGFIGRGVESAGEVGDDPRYAIVDPVSNGVAVRLALLYVLIGGSKSGDID